jgi:hypothetical protein
VTRPTQSWAYVDDLLWEALDTAGNHARVTLLDYCPYSLAIGGTPVHRFKIIYNNGQEAIVTGKRYRADGLWIIFEDADKREVYCVNERDVRSIHQEAGLGDIP